MRTRKYMTDIVGGEGNVLQHHLKPQDLEKKFEAAHISDQAPVKQFLQKVTADQEGWVGMLCFARSLYVWSTKSFVEW